MRITVEWHTRRDFTRVADRVPTEGNKGNEGEELLGQFLFPTSFPSFPSVETFPRPR